MKLKVIGSGPWSHTYRSLLPFDEHTDSSLPDAAIIVSKSHQHHPDTIQYLRWKIPCLVEKPFAMSVPQCEEMIKCAEDNGTYLAAAHVLKFDRRIAAFREKVGNYVKVIWTDPCNGRYDPTVPVEADVLPHIVSIIDTFCPSDEIDCDGVSYGGRGRDIRLQAGRVTFDIHLERDAWKRQRIIDTGYDCLNFSALPEDHNPLRDLIQGFLYANYFIDVTPRPDGEVCELLHTDLALKACRVTEDVLSMAEKCRPSVEVYAGP
jgi:hypothetical protein